MNELDHETPGGKNPEEEEDTHQFNVKLSNFYNEKIMIQRGCHCAFSLLVLCLYVKISYMRYRHSIMENVTEVLRAELDNQCVQLLIFSNIISLFQCLNQLLIYVLKIDWLKSKRWIHPTENLISIGYFKWWVIQSLCVLAQPYWFLHNYTIKDPFNEDVDGIKFQINDILTVLQIFLKLIPVYIFLIELTSRTDPKA